MVDKAALRLYNIKALNYIVFGDVPKWLKGPDSKSGRSAPPAQEFESLHLRHACGNLPQAFLFF